MASPGVAFLEFQDEDQLGKQLWRDLSPGSGFLRQCVDTQTCPQTLFNFNLASQAGSRCSTFGITLEAFFELGEAPLLCCNALQIHSKFTLKVSGTETGKEEVDVPA